MNAGVTLYLYLTERHGWIWQTETSAPMWSFNLGYVGRQRRRWRMARNVIRAYSEMLAGTHNASVHEVVFGGPDPEADITEYPVTRVSASQLHEQKALSTHHVVKIHTPFVSRGEVDWAANPNELVDNHVFVDASHYPDGPQGTPVAAYAIHAEGTTKTYELKTAMSSVDAELQGLQHAIMHAYHLATESGESVTVFSDCTAALTKVILRQECDSANLLGERVFVQWSPGHHHAVKGMVAVDHAARDLVRELAAAY